MTRTVFFNTYKLKKGASAADLLLAAEDLRSNYISKQKGYVSFEVMNDGEVWADATTFQTMQDARAFAQNCEPNAFAEHFYTFNNMNSCKTNFFSTELSDR